MLLEETSVLPAGAFLGTELLMLGAKVLVSVP